jgi:hypothetical protein
MLRPCAAAIILTAGFGFTSLGSAAEGTNLEMLNKALAESKSSGKPMLVIGGAPER